MEIKSASKSSEKNVKEINRIDISFCVPIEPTISL
jgi:hypothetical protein